MQLGYPLYSVSYKMSDLYNENGLSRTVSGINVDTDQEGEVTNVDVIDEFFRKAVAGAGRNMQSFATLISRRVIENG